LANAAQFRQTLVRVAPQLFCDGKLLACGNRITLVFRRQTKGVVAASVARVLVDHFPRSELGQRPFIGLTSSARNGIELDQRLASGIGSGRGDKLPFDLLHQPDAFARFSLREQDFGPQRLGIGPQPISFGCRNQNQRIASQS